MIGFLFVLPAMFGLAAATPPPGQEQPHASDPVAAELFAQIRFQSVVSTPDALDPYIVPYMHCLMAASGTLQTDSEGKELPSTAVPEGGCAPLRSGAEEGSEAALVKLGVKRPQDRKDIIEKSLRAVELSVEGNIAWMKQ